jgi:hypothetical protein
MASRNKESSMESTTVQVDTKRWEKLVEMERKQKLSARRASIKNLIYVEKAKATGIQVSKAEVDARMITEDAQKASEAVPAAEAE